MISKSGNNVRHNVNLDFLRGTAALFVLFEHLSKFHFVDINQITNKTALIMFFYLFRNSGSDAVMVFFVLSGFLVGGSIIDTDEKNKWSWIKYIIARLSRLWTVLIPALLFTFLLDSLGRSLEHCQGYEGLFFKGLKSGPDPQHLGSLSLSSLFENLFFLQTIVAPTFGSNGPLWSLANEFWYYLTFPFLYFLFKAKKGENRKYLYLLILVGFLVFLPKGILVLGVVWLFGFGAYICVKIEKIFGFTRSFKFFVLSVTLFLISFFATQDVFQYPYFLEKLLKHGSLPADGLIGFTFAGTVPYLATHNYESKFYKYISGWLSNISYSLYLFHFPLLAFFYFSFILPHFSQPNLLNLLSFCFVFFTVLGYATLMWYLFERHTNKVRKYLENIFLNKAQKDLMKAETKD